MFLTHMYSYTYASLHNLCLRRVAGTLRVYSLRSAGECLCLHWDFRFANDAPFMQPDGKMAPLFRIQPKLHFDIVRNGESAPADQPPQGFDLPGQ